MPCPVCGATVARTGERGPLSVYCSRRCRRRADYDRSQLDGRAAARRAKRQAAAQPTARRTLRAEEARALVTARGFPTQRGTDEWMAHPCALDDLFRVVCGTPVSAISRERAGLRALEDGRGVA